MWTDLDLALRIVREAAELAAGAFASDTLHVRHKADGSEVTAIDLAIEDLVRRRLTEAVPDDGVAGEERPERCGTSGRRWLVDPISGTADFVRGRPTYSVDLAMTDAHGPALAVSALPSLGLTMAAGRGIGCRVFNGADETAARVSTQDSVVGARVCLHGKKKPALDGCVVVDNSVSVLSLVTGEADAIVVAGAQLDEFDLACLPVLVQEAGGRVTITEDVVLATNGVLHEAFLGVLSRPTWESNPVSTLLQSVSRPS
ncbi:inositol monophosphatase family protein [Lentzea flava]|uniref:Histidinol-phosphatase n=1 Tax=Lentzea flava TaxID=103732 RepID=A0ABQ2UN88_9PSEU|nr:inositol monophosphatase family protein [Lentzea flava]MCP2201839.1 histidinol-phosphatase [Lentzea flava]GGU45039.1 histidinol-phosphatase [Lentzea flava]